MLGLQPGDGIDSTWLTTSAGLGKEERLKRELQVRVGRSQGSGERPTPLSGWEGERPEATLRPGKAEQITVAIYARTAFSSVGREERFPKSVA